MSLSQPHYHRYETYYCKIGDWFFYRLKFALFKLHFSNKHTKVSKQYLPYRIAWFEVLRSENNIFKMHCYFLVMFSVIQIGKWFELTTSLAVLFQANITRTNHIMWTMGTDFKYQYAHTWFRQMDKFIHYVNQVTCLNSKVTLLDYCILAI